MKVSIDNMGEGIVAVVVGIDGYKKTPLRCAVNDAVSLSEVLKKVWAGRHFYLQNLVWAHFGDGVQGMTERYKETWGVDLPKDARGVTRDGILLAVKEAVGKVLPTDTFLFYFAGHGRLIEGKPCLVTICDAETAEGIDFLDVKEIQDAANDCPSRKRVMILDCCQTSGEASVAFFDCLRGLTGDWSIFVSCSPGERSLEDVVSNGPEGDYLEQGLFTASVVRGLRGEAALSRDASLTLMELALFVCNRVQVESEERVAEALCTRGKQQLDSGQNISIFQHPVLLSQAAAIGGPLQMVVAPTRVPSKQDLRRSWPSHKFLEYWRRFMLGNWPIEFSRKHMVREGGALLYAGTMLLTFLWFCRLPFDLESFILTVGVGLGSALLWWAMIPFAVAANEDGWHAGGYVTGISYFLWHCLICILSYFSNRPANIIPLGANFFLILLVVIICGCNASQAIIALAEPLRKDQRREIREAITAFRQFRTHIGHIDLFNLVAMVSARPSVYYFVLGLTVLVLAAHTIYVATRFSETPELWIILLRNVFALAITAWQVFWYTAAFQFIRREVYKR
jgi:hypothetical protein